MSQRTIKIARLATTKPQHFIEVSVSYTTGRGYSLGVWPIEDKGDGCFSCFLFSGASRFIEPAARFNYKRLAQLADQGDKLPGYRELIEKVLANEKLTLASAGNPELVPPNQFNETDCGGVFDGNGVVSDADPGL
jgi:hypothetical protein